MPEVAAPSSQEILESLAAPLYRRYGHGPAAVEKLKRKIAADESLLDYVLGYVAAQVLMGVQRKTRAKIIHGKPGPASGSQGYIQKVYSEELVEAINQSCRNLLEWPMSDGTLLRNANLEKITKDSERYKTLACGNATNGRFLELVGQGLRGEGDVVGEMYSDVELEQLMQKAEEECKGEQSRSAR
jgi:hypothetical protein